MLRLSYAFFNIYYEPFASDDYYILLYFKVNYSFNHYLTIYTVNMAFLLQLCN